MTDLKIKVNRLSLSDEQFREYKLTTRLTELREELPKATDLIDKFEQATRKRWETEDRKKKEENASQNLQTAADFYQKLADLSGNYSATTDYQNQLLAAQAAIYARSLGPEHQKFVDEWERLSRLQSRRDGWDGARRSVLAFYSEATDLGKGFEQATTNMLDGISGAFQITTEGLVVNWNNAMTTMANDFLQIFMRNIVGNIVNSGMDWLGGFFNFGASASTMSELNALADSIVAVPRRHSGGMADEPSFYRAMPVSVFETVPRYYSGHNLPWNPSFEQPAVIRRDESVLTPGQMRTLAGMGGGKEAVRPVVNVPMTVEVHYSGQERPVVARQRSRVDGERMVMELWLSGYENNTLGVRDRMAQG